MKILFLNPPFQTRFSRTSRSPAVTKGGTLYYPIWLSYAAGVAEREGHDIRLIDAPAQGLMLEDVFERLSGFEPDLAVIDTSTPSIYSDAETARKIKEKYPFCFNVLVGTHPSALPEDTLLLNDSIDAVAVGEYDYTITDLAKSLEGASALGGVDGLMFKKSGAVIKNKSRAKIENLDELVFVSSVYKKHLNYKNYFFAAANYPMVMIITGRGCPFNCFFCVYPQVFHSRRYRGRSAESVVEEFEYIRDNFPGVREVGIEDDCFSADRKRVKEICSLLIEKKIKLKWYCNVRADIDYELLKLMRRAGCRLVTVGFESGSQAVLDAMHKGMKASQYLRFAREAKRAGVLVHGCIMVGNPGDSKKTLEESYEFARKANCDSMQFYPLYVYPGTEAYRWAKDKGYLKTEDFSRWLTPEGLHNCVLDTEGLSSGEMVSLCDYYLKKYHLRPRYLFMKLIQAFKDPGEGYRSFKSAKVFLTRLSRGQLGRGV
ncbi:MAG: radical SAM protein [Candidatus Omnitrophica bacterium]|nr:radical SAM protein [Candidatus Omnitrophota bacterium]